jgi:hypothetical protein
MTTADATLEKWSIRLMSDGRDMVLRHDEFPEEDEYSIVTAPDGIRKVYMLCNGSQLLPRPFVEFMCDHLGISYPPQENPSEQD